MTKQTLTLISKSENLDSAMGDVNYTRMTFYKDFEAAKAGGPIDSNRIGAMDLMIPSTEAAAYTVGEKYTVSIAAVPSLALVPDADGPSFQENTDDRA